MKILDWGRISYTESSAKQLELVDKVSSDLYCDQLIFCTHPPVVTVGRGTKAGDVFGWEGEIVETTRGGRATYHGPSQLIAYPILNLNFSPYIVGTRDVHGIQFSPRDLHGYMRSLESAVVETLHEFGIIGEARTLKAEADVPSLTGVWVGEKKIASIGIAVKKWVTYHGIALNVEDDQLAFSGINPCGFKSTVMTSMAKVLGSESIDRFQVRNTFESFLLKNLSRDNAS